MERLGTDKETGFWGWRCQSRAHMGSRTGRWEAKWRKDLGLDPHFLRSLFQGSSGTWWESIFKIEHITLPVYLGAIQCVKDKLKGKGVQDEIWRGRNGGAGRQDGEGSPACSPASCLSKLMGHSLKIVISFLLHWKNLHSVLYWKISCFLFFFYPRGRCSNKLPRKELWWVTERKFSRNDNTSQKWELLHLLYMGTVKMLFYCTWSWIGKDWHFHTSL